MKKSTFLSILLICFSFSLVAQLEMSKKEPCWYKGAKRDSMRYVDFECGVLLGVIDCNDKLEFDEGQNIFFAKGTGTPYTGDCETCHNNGIREHLIHFVNGKEDGTDTTFYRSGCTMVVRSLVLGVENGRWIYYYDSIGRPAWIMNYLDGALNGEQIYFNQFGDTTRWEFYKLGVLDGVKRTYYFGSKLEEEINYKNGIFDGDYLTYFESGLPSKKLHFKAGKKDGKLEYYYNNGALLTVENYVNGIKNGEFKTFYIDGTLQSTENYVKGKKEGWFFEKYPSGRTKSEYLYEKDEQIEYRKYNEYGKLLEGTPKVAAGMEDDSLPGKSKVKKPKKAKKPKKVKEKKQKAPKTPK
jgi:antitoxin component YwqK of YwqJK toxin-antitoxin module